MENKRSITTPEDKMGETDSDLISLVERAKCKEKLNVNDQLRYLVYKGITFKSYESPDSPAVWKNPILCNYFMNNSYYYKLTSYRKNFPKNSIGKYQKLDFDHLKDLAIIGCKGFSCTQ